MEEFLYFINYKKEHKDICELEMKSIFGKKPEGKYIYSSLKINPSRSVFLNWRLNLKYKSNTLNELVIDVEKDELLLEDYRINFLTIDSDVNYASRLDAMSKIGWCINGSFSLKSPKVELAVTKKDGVWLFGYYEKSDSSWLTRKQKPHNYSFALDVWLSKTLVNIAMENDLKKSLVDPCCGVGTVLIEALILGVNIKGYDFNQAIVNLANENIEFFGFNGNTICSDIKDINETYDVAIIDLPYGQFIKSHSDTALTVIQQSKKIANRIIFVSMIDITDLLNEYELQVIDKCTVMKRSKFSRFITICDGL